VVKVDLLFLMKQIIKCKTKEHNNSDNIIYYNIDFGVRKKERKKERKALDRH
jgi:hypothetical protein